LQTETKKIFSKGEKAEQDYSACLFMCTSSNNLLFCNKKTRSVFTDRVTNVNVYTTLRHTLSV